MAPPDLATRARGALLGHAAGNVLGVPTEFLNTPDGIRARFPEGIRDVQRQDTPDSPYDDDLALTLLLAEELLQPEVDLRRLALAWAGWGERDGRGHRAVDPAGAAAHPGARRPAVVDRRAGGERHHLPLPAGGAADLPPASQPGERHLPHGGP
jgi:hypothetical protein